jgi:hypothetical protein
LRFWAGDSYRSRRVRDDGKLPSRSDFPIVIELMAAKDW